MRVLLLLVPLAAAVAQAQEPSMARLRDLKAECGSHWGECGSMIETSQLRHAGRLAFRDSSGLHLRLLSGEYHLLARDTSDWPATYQFHAYLRPFGQFLIHLQYGEGDGYALVSARDAKIIHLDDIPVFAPSGNRFVVASGDFITNYNPTSLSVWRIGRSAVTREWSWSDSAMTAGWVPGNPMWIGETSIVVDYMLPDPTTGSETPGPVPALLRYQRGRWTLTLPQVQDSTRS